MTALAETELAPENAARNRSVIAILLVSTFVVFLNETIMSVALPRLMTAFDATASQVQWLTTAFLLTMAVVIPVTGFLIQRTNTRPLFILAMSLFSLGTLAAALSPNLTFLIVARIIQALGTAIMMPLLMTTVMTLVPAHRRGPVMGNISLVLSVAPAVGPAISGIVLHFLPWPFMFWFVLPVSLLTLYFGSRTIVNVTTPRYVPVDVLSVILSALAFGSLVYGLSSFGEGSDAAGAISGFIPIGIGAAAMAVFAARQIALQKRDMPLLDLRTFRSRNFTFSVCMMATSMAVLFGIIILLPIYMQDVLGVDTLKTGLLLLPGGLLMGILGPQAGKLYERFGPRRLLVPGSMLVSMVLFAMTQLGPNTWWVYIFIGHLTISIGLAFLFTPLFTVALSSVSPRIYSHGSAIVGSVQQIAGAAGIALFITIMTLQTKAHGQMGDDPLTALSAGITAAFLVGAFISLVSVVVACFIRPAPEFEEPGAMVAAH